VKKKQPAEGKGMIACIEILDAVITNIKRVRNYRRG
jgi:hypothetical protein